MTALGEYTLKYAAIAIVGWVVGIAVYRMLSRWNVLDIPNPRSSHDRPVVRGGGLAILLVWAAWLWLDSDASAGALGGPRTLFGLAMVAAISFIDDIRSLPFPIRLAVHGIAAALFLSVVRLPEPGWWWVVLGWFWIVGYTNAVNFMDGVNGLAGMQAIITGLFGAIFCALAGAGDAAAPLIGLLLALSAAALGFLPHNFPRARMFLGDVGSVSIGFLLAVFAILIWDLAGWRAGLAFAALQLNCVLDTVITLLRRFLEGEPLHKPHREFFFHRLNRAGKSHTFVTVSESILLLVSGGLLTAVLDRPPAAFAAVIGGLIVVWLIFLWYCEHSFRSASSAPDRGT